MKTHAIVVDPKAPQADAIGQAVAALRRGGLVAFPTDTLYALGADALAADAVERVLAVKGRARGKPLSVLVPSVDAIVVQVEPPLGAIGHIVDDPFVCNKLP